MAEFSYTVPAIEIPPGGFFTFNTNPVPCDRGFVRWRQGTGAFNLSGWIPNCIANKCCKCRTQSAIYLVDFGANIAVPTGQTVGPISAAFTVDGVVLPETEMTVTPAAVEEFFNISRAANVQVFRNCCQTFGIQNTSTIPILASNFNVIFARPDLDKTY
jgi:hypothetical protein